MFGKKPIIVCVVTPEQTLDASFIVDTGKVLRVEHVVLGISFQTLKTTHHVSHVRLLVSEDDAYLKLLRFPKGTIITRDTMLEKTREIIPEEIIDTYFDWKEVSIGNDELGVQVFAVKQSVLAPLMKTASIEGVMIDAVESPSLAMARLTKHIKESFLLVYPPAKPEYLVAVSGGKVLEVGSVDPLHSLEDAKRAFVRYVAKLWGVTLTAIATDMPSPMVGLASKVDFQGEDMEVLTIPSSQSAMKRAFHLPIPLIIGVVALLVVIVAFVVMQFVRPKTMTATTNNTSTPTVAVSVSPQPTEKPIQRTSLLVEVQNGSGETGVAGKGKTVLETAGYTGVTTGNADNYDYQGVIVKGKTVNIALLIVADIRATYTSATASSTLLDTGSSVDGIVILGRE